MPPVDQKINTSNPYFVWIVIKKCSILQLKFAILEGNPVRRAVTCKKKESLNIPVSESCWGSYPSPGRSIIFVKNDIWISSKYTILRSENRKNEKESILILRQLKDRVYFWYFAIYIGTWAFLEWDSFKDRFYVVLLSNFEHEAEYYVDWGTVWAVQYLMLTRLNDYPGL